MISPLPAARLAATVWGMNTFYNSHRSDLHRSDFDPIDVDSIFLPADAASLALAAQRTYPRLAPPPPPPDRTGAALQEFFAVCHGALARTDAANANVLDDVARLGESFLAGDAQLSATLDQALPSRLLNSGIHP